MTTIDEENLEIQVSETLSFEHPISSLFEGMRDNIEYAFEKGEYEEFKEDVQHFLQYTLTPEDKVKILRNIAEDYEQEVYRSNYVTIFDEDIIRRGINQWIEEKFGFSAD